jgi:uncharacterized protein (DUF1800 family)
MDETFAGAVPLASPAEVTTPPPEVRVLNRMAFGPRPGDPARVRRMGIDAYVEEQLRPEAIDDSAFQLRYAGVGFELLDASVPALWARQRVQGQDWETFYRRAYNEVNWATWLRALYSKKQLFEVLVDHWHNHFNVYGDMSPVHYLWPDYDRRIRKNALGNFRQMLEDVAASTPMLRYLNNSTSRGSSWNENYARELLELHTLGAEAYTPGQARPPAGQSYDRYRDYDVYEAARCLTGWTVNDETGEFQYRDEADWHDPGQKQFLGIEIPHRQAPLYDGRLVLDTLSSHPATARHVSRRLARRLVSDRPSASIVSAGAEAFLANQGAADQLRHVVRAILKHPDFLEVWGEKVKRPFELAAGALRATRAEWLPIRRFEWAYDPLGQPLFEWRPPDGFPDTRRVWLGSVRMVRRWNFFNSLCLHQIGNDSEGRILANIEAQTPASAQTPRQIVDFWVDRLLGYAVSESEATPLYDFMARGRNLDQTLPAAERNFERLAGLAALVLSLPAAQLR